MALAITPLHPYIGAEIGGLDVSRPIDDATVAALWRAIDRHAVLVFRDQQITDEQLRSFAARFGELEIGRSAARGGAPDGASYQASAAAPASATIATVPPNPPPRLAVPRRIRLRALSGEACPRA